MQKFLLPVIFLVGLVNSGLADDWPQWLGPQRDGEWREQGILKSIPASGLKIKWRAPIHGGYSGPAVAGDRVFVTDYLRESGEIVNGPGTRTELKGQERLLCLDASSGKELWKYSYPRDYRLSYACGPRAVPTVSEGMVYLLGAEGDLSCLTADTGKLLWQKSLTKEYKTETPIWGFSAHPLVDGEKLICVVGGENSTAVAFDKKTGKELWKAITARHPGYCPPSIIEAAGKRQLLIWDADELHGMNPETGDVYWSFPLAPNYDMSIMAPRKFGEFLFASGIGDVGVCLKLNSEKPGLKQVWRGNSKSAVYCANSTPFINDGIIYGCCCNQGQLRGVKLETGERLWETFAATTGTRRASHGTAFIVKIEDRFILFSETGDLLMASLSASGYKELGRFHVLKPTGECFGRDVVWSHPAYAHQAAFVRNDEEIVCVSLKE